MNLYLVKTEDPTDRDARYKAYMIIAPDSATAAQLVPRRVVVTSIELKRRLRGNDLVAQRCGYISSSRRFV